MAENVPQGAAFDRSYKEETSFINHVPKTREEREALRDKDKLEKVRLEDRKGCYYKYDGNSEDNILLPPQNSLAYQDDTERFYRDFAAEEYGRRLEKKFKDDERYAKKRAELSEREVERWNKMEREYVENEAKAEALQDSSAAKRNASSVNYNVITLKYANTHGGQLLKYEDDTIRYRATLRGRALEQKMSSVEYDLLTGDAKIDRVKVSDKPEPPVAS
ncbi:hypothetical protein HOP50_13g69060 [Chloropicon primus]|uniref:Uncharacterized protein n=1 Tax=Chloropicon primus TaxID=1764295 RepID=A0A5B8MUB4_9CHLO|nr:hypothetical protein A3770_13p68860 [Chloropicon primus]UPR03576.1 hypothetical protein HOP50_13g69060 [Chloropicon primus]|eukprot:QDZ24368.1 hypothetical protein A3770_13p68860 [Chloropicon primus]